MDNITNAGENRLRRLERLRHNKSLRRNATLNNIYSHFATADHCSRSRI